VKNNFYSILRIEHWFKNIIIFPGIIAGAILKKNLIFNESLFLEIILCIISTSLIASSNYLINEYLDRKEDKYHPIKKKRFFVKKKISFFYIFLIYLFFIFLGFLFSKNFSTAYKVILFIFVLCGIFYNVWPFRLKNYPIVDVLFESINNVIRFLLGWLIILPNQFPPISLILAFWMGGAYLMNVKRFAEYRFINNSKIAGLYRKSFIFYTENFLLIMSFLYALFTIFFTTIFLIKYKIEFIISMPFVSILFAYYLKLGLDKESLTQNPEKLYKSKELIIILILVIISLLFCAIINLPILNILTVPLDFNS
jgi:4-hydroxybenzoate polyprenyltransferase